jgi:hypothetical protein
MSPGGLLRRAREDAAKYARMTVEDVVELGAVFTQVARRQVKDAGVDVGGLLGRSLRRAGPHRRWRGSAGRRE